MKVFKTVTEIESFLRNISGKTGFVPTMGALHLGHISLIEKAKKETDLVICSIFVNPKQFNDASDLHKYPRTLEKDTIMLEKAGCDVLFAPSVDEVYPNRENSQFEFGNLDKVMEGEFRPGHFNGVAIVVKRLFEIINPDKAYFGQKDFQQVAIIKKLTKTLNLPVDIVVCPIIREPDGLAMSSRNIHLNSEERKEAANISRILFKAKELASQKSVQEVKSWVLEQISKFPLLKTEYFDIVDAETLHSVNDWQSNSGTAGCIAVRVGTTRLIDNILFR